MRIYKNNKMVLYSRNISLITLLFIFGCSKQPINYETDLIEKEGVYYTKDSNRPYSGPVFTSFDSGAIKEEGSLKEGFLSGSWIYWNEDGNKYSEETYKNSLGREAFHL